MHDAMGALPDSGQQSVSKLDGCLAMMRFLQDLQLKTFIRVVRLDLWASTFPHMRGREMDAG
jgi:hypothetical protein